MLTVQREYRLASMPAAQCHIVIGCNPNGKIQYVNLVSYNTLVISIESAKEGGGVPYVLKCTGTYSATTARHINRFTTEFLGSNQYYMCKALASGKVKWIDVFNTPEWVDCIEATAREYWNGDAGRRYYGNY